jgi:hypothetical protein
MSSVSGTATIIAGNAFVDVPHGLSSTPNISQISLTPQDDLGGRTYWPSNVGSATFRINMSFADPDTNHSFSWQISVPAGQQGPAPPVSAYITIVDAQGHLNMSYDSGSGNYTVYGLTLSTTALQAHVDYANAYVTALTGGLLDASDQRYPHARIAALDLACMRALVISSGGSLVSAFDYFLGDLRVARTAPYAAALARTIQGLSDDLQKQLVNLTTPVVTAEASMQGDVPTYEGGLMNP